MTLSVGRTGIKATSTSVLAVSDRVLYGAAQFILSEGLGCCGSPHLFDLFSKKIKEKKKTSCRNPKAF